MKGLLALSIVALLLNNCGRRTESNLKMKSRAFTSFELTYKTSLKSFGFMVDSNKIFFSPKTWDTVKYGFLPDTLFALIDSSISKILNGKAFKSNEILRSDTFRIGIRLIVNQDTIKIIQSDKQVESAFSKIIAPIEFFINKDHLILNNSAMILETDRMTLPKPGPPSHTMH